MLACRLGDRQVEERADGAHHRVGVEEVCARVAGDEPARAGRDEVVVPRLLPESQNAR
jgi:hypothetical protein